MDRSDKVYISADWKKWIAERLLLGRSQEELTEVLVENGFPRELARLEVDTAASHPYMQAALSAGRKLKKRDWVFDTLRLLEADDQSSIIQRRQAVSQAEFYREYYFKNRPVVLTDALQHCGALQRWNPEYLKALCGDQLVEIQARRNSNPLYEIQSNSHKQTLSFADYVDLVCTSQPTNDFYMTANNADANAEFMKKLWDDIDALPQYLDPGLAQDRTFFWFGPAGTVTPLHHDLTNNFMAQVIGRKRIKLISPLHLPAIYNHYHCYSEVDLENVDFHRFPKLRGVRVYELTLNPGELFFLPVGWWHHVRGLDISITITSTNFRARNDFTQSYDTFGSI